jgi:hypothetical protein
MGNFKCAVWGGEGGEGEEGVAGAERNPGAGDGAMLGIVDDAVDLAEDGGVSCGGGEEKYKGGEQGKFAHGNPLSDGGWIEASGNGVQQGCAFA